MIALILMLAAQEAPLSKADAEAYTAPCREALRRIDEDGQSGWLERQLAKRPDMPEADKNALRMTCGGYMLGVFDERERAARKERFRLR